MWESLGAEETFSQESAKPFVFPLNEITNICFGKIVEWMENHNGHPEPVVKEDPITGEVEIFVKIQKKIYLELAHLVRTHRLGKEFLRCGFRDHQRVFCDSKFPRSQVTLPLLWVFSILIK